MITFFKNIFKVLVAVMIILTVLGAGISLITLSYVISLLFGVSFFGIVCIFLIGFFALFYGAVLLFDKEEENKENNQINS